LTDNTLAYFASLKNLSKVSFKNLRPAFTFAGYQHLQEVVRRGKEGSIYIYVLFKSGLKKWDAEEDEIVLLRTFENH
jgi:hypothetical protein